MQDFASAAMVRLLVRAMAAHGLVPPPPPPGADGLAASHVPLAYKRSVVEAVLHQGGLGTLLQLAQRVDLLAGDPVHRALLGANVAHYFIAGGGDWQRMCMAGVEPVVGGESARRAIYCPHRQRRLFCFGIFWHA